jgi:undecaprenyl diphosphate synthase
MAMGDGQKKRKRPRSMGHQAGLKALRACIEHCVQLGVETLTVFAFSSENWNRPSGEISRLMELFFRALNKEALEMHENGICIRFIGDKSGFKTAIQQKMMEAEILTANNKRMVANIAVNYGGRWDITQAARRMAKAVTEGRLLSGDISEAKFEQYLALAKSPDPDLFIRTGGEMRISNFLLWQSAYTELYFSASLWPDFDKQDLEQAIETYRTRERRFGQTSEQLEGMLNA